MSDSSKDFDSVNIYLKEIGEIPRLSKEEEIDLFHKVNSGDEEARRLIVKANLKLVVRIARKYSKLGVPFNDLINEGNLGLIRASQKFDLTKGCRFSTYASWWIKQFIMRALANQGKTIRLPVYMVERISRVERFVNDFKAKHNREPSNEEISDKMQIDGEKVAEIFQIAKKTQSINQQLDENFELGDVIEDKTTLHSERVVSTAMLQEEIIDMLSYLKPREMEIVSRRFGLDGERPKTLKEIGQMYSISRERVRQVEDVCLRKLKKLMKKKKIFYADFWPDDSQ
jgi:RNA polymerase primary sigma factor